VLIFVELGPPNAADYAIFYDVAAESFR